MIRLGRWNEAVERYGMQSEIIQAEPGVCANILAKLWETVGRLKEVSGDLEGATLSPLFKKGNKISGQTTDP